MAKVSQLQWDKEKWRSGGTLTQPPGHWTSFPDKGEGVSTPTVLLFNLYFCISNRVPRTG